MSHITYEQRYTISCMLKEGYNQSEIGKAIGKSKSVLSRELKRNKDQHSSEYRHDLAQKKYCTRKAAIPKHSRFTDEVKADIEALLNDNYSPEQIVEHYESKVRTAFRMKQFTNTFGTIKNKMETYIHIFEGKDETIGNEATARTLGA